MITRGQALHIGRMALDARALIGDLMKERPNCRAAISVETAEGGENLVGRRAEPVDGVGRPLRRTNWMNDILDERHGAVHLTERRFELYADCVKQAKQTTLLFAPRLRGRRTLVC